MTNATTGAAVQLSASSATTLTLGAGSGILHPATFIGSGFDAVGGISSPTLISCVTNDWFPHASVTLYVLVITSGHVAPFD